LDAEGADRHGILDLHFRSVRVNTSALAGARLWPPISLELVEVEVGDNVANTGAAVDEVTVTLEYVVTVTPLVPLARGLDVRFPAVTELMKVFGHQLGSSIQEPVVGAGRVSRWLRRREYRVPTSGILTGVRPYGESPGSPLVEVPNRVGTGARQVDHVRLRGHRR
jgi:hypothetical protein